jgi:hypothetical protein
MSVQPAERPEANVAEGAGLSGQTKGRTCAYVKVTNPVWNGSGYIKRKTANFYVGEGRAIFVGEDQLRLIESHPKNRAAYWRAAQEYLRVHRTMTRVELSHLPVVRPDVLLTDRSVPVHRTPAGRSGRVRVLMQGVVPIRRGTAPSASGTLRGRSVADNRTPVILSTPVENSPLYRSKIPQPW